MIFALSEDTCVLNKNISLRNESMYLPFMCFHEVMENALCQPSLCENVCRIDMENDIWLQVKLVYNNAY